jgi:acyl-CoA dehydrogenase
VTESDVADRVVKVLPVLRATAAEVDADAVFPERSMFALRQSGLLGLLVPSDHGGLGGDLADLVEVAQQLAAGCQSTAMIYAMHCQQVDAIVRFGNDDLKRVLLPRIAGDGLYLGSVTTEAGKGGSLLTGMAPLTRNGDGWTIERHAPIVTGGAYADGFVITMRAAPDARENELTLVYADREQLDLHLHGDWNPLGMRGTHSVALQLKGTVPGFQVIGEPGRFRVVAVESLAAVGHLSWAACWLGAARGALAEVVALVRSPRRPPSIDLHSDLVAERLARVRIDLEIVGAYLHRVCDEVTALRKSGGSLDNAATQIHLNTLKVVAAERTFDAVDRLVQLSGMSLGYRRDAAVPLERHFRDLRSASLNHANDRLVVATGKLTLMDRNVALA